MTALHDLLSPLAPYAAEFVLGLVLFATGWILGITGRVGRLDDAVSDIARWKAEVTGADTRPAGAEIGRPLR